MAEQQHPDPIIASRLFVPPDPAEAPSVQVRFGKQPYQLLPLPVAEQILCAMSEGYPQLFGRLLAEAWIGPEAVKRGRPPR